MKLPQEYTPAEIKMIDRALKKDWKKKRIIAQIILIVMIVITGVIALQTPHDSKSQYQLWPIFLAMLIWANIMESYRYFELIKKLAISNVGNDSNKP